MQLTLALAALAISFTNALPHTATTSTPTTTTSPACVTSAVNQQAKIWVHEIKHVNEFLNTATNLAPSALASQAALLQQDKKGEAADEPNHLMALAPCGAPQGNTAVSILEDVFGGVLGNLSIIEANAQYADIVECAVSAIDYLRCNIVLVQIQTLFHYVYQNTELGAAVARGPSVCPLPSSGIYPSPTQFNIHSCGPTAAPTA